MIPKNIAPWTFFACVAPSDKWSGSGWLYEVTVARNEEGKMVPKDTLTKKFVGTKVNG